MSKQRGSNDPYRIILWGPGALGQACIREILERPEFKLVGALAYSEAKNGKDVGELIGRGPLGVKITTDKEAIYAMKADVVIWLGLPFYNMDAMEQEILCLLESGKNVVSAASHHYPPQHGKAYTEKLEAACRKGQSSLYGTGENPGYWFERMVPTLSGLCTSVETIFLDEYVDVCAGGTRAESLRGVGFGMTIEEAEVQSKHLQRIWGEYYYVESMEMVAQSIWGRSVERWNIEPRHYPAETDIVFDKAKGDPITMTIHKGGIYGIVHTITGLIDDQPRVKIRFNWCLRAENSPFPYKGSDVWKIEIEGKPVSLRCQFEGFASLKGDLKFRPGEQMGVHQYATIVPMIQAIPIVVGHKPGIVVPSVFASCVPDFRQLEHRSSIVDVHHYQKSVGSM
jgi:hypothetical protein